MSSATKRVRTNYPGVYYRLAKRLGGKGEEKVYYYKFKKAGKNIEEKAGREKADNMTPAKTSRIRSERIEGKRPSPKEIRNAQKDRKKVAANKWTINKIWDEYKDQNSSKSSIKQDKSRYNLYLKDKFGKIEPHKIIQLDLDRLRINLLKKKSPQTVKHTVALLRRLIRFAVKKGLIVPPVLDFEMPKVNNEKTEDLSPNQLKRLLKAIKKDKHTQAGNMMLMALYTGMRRGEMFKLQWQDVDLRRGFITIRDPKGGLEQKIPINDSTHNLLKSIERTSDFVFPGRRGNQRTDINKATNEIKKAAKLPKDFRPLHGLRHVYASMLASSGQVEIYTLQKLLTHKEPKTTQRYAHLRDDALKCAANLVDDLISKP